MKGFVMPATFALALCMSTIAVACGAELVGILTAMLMPTVVWYFIEGRKIGGKWLVGVIVVIAGVATLASPFSTNTSLTMSHATIGDGWSLLNKFSSYEELKHFILNGEWGHTSPVSEPPPAPSPPQAPSPSPVIAPAPRLFEGTGFGVTEGTSFRFKITRDTVSIRTDYSTTNIQVEGVDEADIVKTDGKYLYVISKKAIIIILAYPPEDAKVLSRIELNEPPLEIFVNDDRLVILSSHESIVHFEIPMITEWEQRDSLTIIRIYDISDRGKPTLMEKIEVSGSYFNSRMIGNHAYVIVNMTLTFRGDDVILPTISSLNATREIPATEIYYFDNVPEPNVFAIVVAIDVQNAEKLDEKIVLTTRAGNVYVSTGNIYITYAGRGERSGKTIVHRISVRSGKIGYGGKGEVPGRVLNQFSMDEYEGYFRIATTTGWYGANHLYVLDRDLNIVGRLENLAPGERIYSARFMGERAYLVTFKKVDPLFVIDLEDPRNPKVLGKLKIPGYSDYLHPYDNTHIIGVGKDTIESEWGDFAWYQGVKIALFDVSDPENPKEISKIIIGKRGTESYALEDHRAFLFSRERNLLVIPIGRDWDQDAYVFHISPENGIVLRGTISHDDDTSSTWGRASSSVKRSLYINDVLYTISEGMVKMNSLTDLGEINSVELR